jgi:hypothetical protein
LAASYASMDSSMLWNCSTCIHHNSAAGVASAFQATAVTGCSASMLSLQELRLLSTGSQQLLWPNF